jgi:hypothetical protein
MASSDFNNFPAIASALTPLLHDAVTNTAQEIVEDFAANCAYDTGFMSESGYIVTSDESTYALGMSPVREGSYLLPEVDKPSDDLTAIAAVGANYSADVELGGPHNSPQPAFYPAVDSAAMFFEEELEDVIDELEAQFG